MPAGASDTSSDRDHLLERFRAEWKRRSTAAQRKEWYKQVGSKLTCTACVKRGTSCSEKSDSNTLATTVRCSACLTWKTTGCSREDSERRYRIKSTLGLTDEVYDSLLKSLKKEIREAKIISSNPSLERRPVTRSSRRTNNLPDGDEQSGSAIQAQSSSDFVGDSSPTVVASLSSSKRLIDADQLTALSRTRAIPSPARTRSNTALSSTLSASPSVTNGQTSLQLESPFRLQTPDAPSTSLSLLKADVVDSIPMGRKRKRELPSPTSPSLPNNNRPRTGGAVSSMPAAPSKAPMQLTRPRRTSIKLLPTSPKKLNEASTISEAQQAVAGPSIAPEAKHTDTLVIPETHNEVVPKPQTRSYGAQTMTINPPEVHVHGVQTDLVATDIVQPIVEREQNLALRKRVVALELELGNRNRMVDGFRFDVNMKDVEIKVLGLKLLESQKRCGELEKQNSGLVQKERERSSVLRVDREVQNELGMVELEVVKAEMRRELELKDIEIHNIQEQLKEMTSSKRDKADVEVQTIWEPASSPHASQNENEDIETKPDSPDMAPSQVDDDDDEEIEMSSVDWQLESVLGQPDASEISANLEGFLGSVAQHEKAEYTFINLLRIEHDKLRDEAIKFYRSVVLEQSHREAGESAGSALFEATRVQEMFKKWDSKLLDIANRRLEIAEMLAPHYDRDSEDKPQEEDHDVEYDSQRQSDDGDENTKEEIRAVNVLDDSGNDMQDEEMQATQSQDESRDDQEVELDENLDLDLGLMYPEGPDDVVGQDPTADTRDIDGMRNELEIDNEQVDLDSAKDGEDEDMNKLGNENHGIGDCVEQDGPDMKGVEDYEDIFDQDFGVFAEVRTVSVDLSASGLGLDESERLMDTFEEDCNDENEEPAYKKRRISGST
ncbi:hypothetical protein K435DRAFT_965125 [Dendrothele bispora CBS 962.96]|uniref:Uncharacterized protein n=1 Tax=Dendrothele bispora (strain CBS 962.96) TaxID=1314807 RepID=A0A4S8M713_DENBC|nr:hypothetical protein K435DRAFT_965125 [Dendrothele bispora CBS 962.96]